MFSFKEQFQDNIKRYSDTHVDHANNKTDSFNSNAPSTLRSGWSL